MGIEQHFDIPFVADLALREKQIQQNYRPVIAIHKWFARRPGTLFRALLLAEFSKGLLRETFYQPNDLHHKRIADPFMGGGTPLMEANRLGCDIIGHDINPMAYWIVKQELTHLNLDEYLTGAYRLLTTLRHDLGDFYRTTCQTCGSRNATAKYFLWVKTTTCTTCNRDLDLFPGYLLAEDKRHPKNVIVCSSCGTLNEQDSITKPGSCVPCGQPLVIAGPASRGSITCPSCNQTTRFPDSAQGPPRHRMFAIEYHCPQCKPTHEGRFFKTPDQDDLQRYAAATEAQERASKRHLPKDAIPAGDETDRLHRWGYQYYRDLFNQRQLLGLQRSCDLITTIKDETVRHALATNLSDLLRYQNMLCRYDTMALKSLDIFSIHGFPVGLVQCESNFLGIEANRTSIGSGGWTNIIAKYLKAKAYCDHPFEIKNEHGKKRVIHQPGEWIGDHRNGDKGKPTRSVKLTCASATTATPRPNTLDAVFTDPPYFGNVQYAELMDFCYVWLRQLLKNTEPAFRQPSTRNEDELTANRTQDRTLDHFTDGLSTVFRKMTRALKPGAPFAFTYHHNTLEAYHPIAVALLDAGLTCTAAIPCPGEMGASIHINGTGSSIIDTIFVCRKPKPGQRQRQRPLLPLDELVGQDRRALREAGITLSTGDERCIAFGHRTRNAINALLPTWNLKRPTPEKLATVATILTTPNAKPSRTPKPRSIKAPRTPTPRRRTATA